MPRDKRSDLLLRLMLGALSFCPTGLLSQQPEIESSTRSSITAEMIGRKKGTAKLKKSAADSEYGYSEKSPVKVGGGFGKGSDNTYKFLNALLGPNAEVVQYDREGTCCSFETENSPFGSGLLEVFSIQYKGGEKKRLYFNWYDESELLIPARLTAKK